MRIIVCTNPLRKPQAYKCYSVGKALFQQVFLAHLFILLKYFPLALKVNEYAV